MQDLRAPRARAPAQRAAAPRGPRAPVSHWRGAWQHPSPAPAPPVCQWLHQAPRAPVLHANTGHQQGNGPGEKPNQGTTSEKKCMTQAF